MDTASRTTSFIRKATGPAIAGNPPAEAAQPSAMNGMIVSVATNVTTEAMAPKIPSLLFQNPENSNIDVNHSNVPRNRAAPRNPKAGYSQKSSGP